MRRFTLLLLFATLAAVGCAKTHDEVIGEHRAAAEKKLSAVERIVERVESLPAIEHDTVDYDGELLTLSDSSGKTTSNAALLFLPAFQDRQAKVDDYYDVVFAHRWWRWTSSVLENRPQSKDEVSAIQLEGHFRQLAAIRYVLVLKPLEYVPPRHEKTDGSLVHYNTGHFSGEVHLFEVATGKHLGGFSIEPANGSLPFGITTTTDKKPLERDLRSYMMIRLKENTINKLRQLLPGRVTAEK